MNAGIAARGEGLGWASTGRDQHVRHTTESAPGDPVGPNQRFQGTDKPLRHGDRLRLHARGPLRRKLGPPYVGMADGMALW